MHILLLVLGFLFLVKGADFFVEGASGIARKLGIPQLVIGLTIVAMGTSLPEAAVSVSAAMSGNPGISIGNIVGSNILNILIILGITAVITNVGIQKSTLYVEIPYMVLITIILAFLGLSGAALGLGEGIALLGLFLAYLAYLFYMTRRSNEKPVENGKTHSIWRCLLLILLGGFLIVKGSDFAVEGATGIARFLGMSERFIGLTVVALGTSLPELVTSVTAARKGNADIAIGNIVGSNIFNILFILGVSALIETIPFEPKFLVDTVVSVAVGCVLWLGTIRNRELRRPFGILMLLLYGVYFVYLCQ